MSSACATTTFSVQRPTSCEVRPPIDRTTLDDISKTLRQEQVKSAALDSSVCLGESGSRVFLYDGIDATFPEKLGLFSTSYRARLIGHQLGLNVIGPKMTGQLGVYEVEDPSKFVLGNVHQLTNDHLTEVDELIRETYKGTFKRTVVEVYTKTSEKGVSRPVMAFMYKPYSVFDLSKVKKESQSGRPLSLRTHASYMRTLMNNLKASGGSKETLLEAQKLNFQGALPLEWSNINLKLWVDKKAYRSNSASYSEVRENFGKNAQCYTGQEVLALHRAHLAHSLLDPKGNWKILDKVPNDHASVSDPACVVCHDPYFHERIKNEYFGEGERTYLDLLFPTKDDVAKWKKEFSTRSSKSEKVGAAEVPKVTGATVGDDSQVVEYPVSAQGSDASDQKADVGAYPSSDED